MEVTIACFADPACAGAVGAGIGYAINAMNNNHNDNAGDNGADATPTPVPPKPANCPDKTKKYPPFTGDPNSTDYGDKQGRSYGDDGYPDTDVDYGHDHNGAGDPHAHDWGRPDNGGAPTDADRGSARPVRPGDPFNPNK